MKRKKEKRNYKCKPMQTKPGENGEIFRTKTRTLETWVVRYQSVIDGTI